MHTDDSMPSKLSLGQRILKGATRTPFVLTDLFSLLLGSIFFGCALGVAYGITSVVIGGLALAISYAERVPARDHDRSRR